MPYAQIPDSLILDPSLTPLARRLYEYLDLKAGTRGYWDDSLIAISRALGAGRGHLGNAARALAERGLIQREQHGHWRTRFVIIARVAGKQLPLDEHPPQVRGGDPVRRRGVIQSGSGGDPIGITKTPTHLYSDKEVLPRRRSTHALRAAGEAYNRNVIRAWPDDEPASRRAAGR